MSVCVCVCVCVCVFLIDYPKINENRSRAHVRVYGFKFYKTRPVLERMCIAQAKQNKKNTCNTWMSEDAHWFSSN